MKTFIKIIFNGYLYKRCLALTYGIANDVAQITNAFCVYIE